MNKANLYEIDKVHNKYLANKEVVHKYYVIVYEFNKYLHIELQVFAWNLLILPIRNKINFDICHPIKRTTEKKPQLRVFVSFMLFKGKIMNCSAWLIRNLRIWAVAFSKSCVTGRGCVQVT